MLKKLIFHDNDVEFIMLLMNISGKRRFDKSPVDGHFFFRNFVSYSKYVIF